MVSKNEVTKITDLAKLDFDDPTLEAFVPSFQQILDFFEQLQRVPTDEIEPTYHALSGQPLETPLREDRADKSVERDRILAAAPDQREGHFSVPKVIE